MNESIHTSTVKLNPYASDNIADGCPVREIIHSAAVATSSTHSAVAGVTSSLADRENRNAGIVAEYSPMENMMQLTFHPVHQTV